MLAFAGLCAPALAADATMVTLAVPPGQSPDNTFQPKTPTIPAGGTLDYDNEATNHHNVYSNDGIGGGPLFDLATFTGPKTKPVQGVEYLKPGTYPFHCTLHPDMTGTLTVTPGTPVTRPKIAVALKDSKLHAVRKSGVLKTKVSDSTTDGVVELTATLGKKNLGHKANIRVAGGDSQKVSLKLTHEGKRALKGLSKAKVKLTGIVDFGKTDSVKKTLK